MKSGDYLICKRTVYFEDEIFPSHNTKMLINDSTAFKKSKIRFEMLYQLLYNMHLIKIKIWNLFRKPIYKKDKKYLIKNISTFSYGVVTSRFPMAIENVNDIIYLIYDEDRDISSIPEGILYDTFYSPKELRKLKLKKLK